MSGASNFLFELCLYHLFLFVFFTVFLFWKPHQKVPLILRWQASTESCLAGCSWLMLQGLVCLGVAQQGLARTIGSPDSWLPCWRVAGTWVCSRSEGRWCPPFQAFPSLWKQTDPYRTGCVRVPCLLHSPPEIPEGRVPCFSPHRYMVGSLDHCHPSQ